MEFGLLGASAVAVAAVYGTLWLERRRGYVSDLQTNLWDVALGAMVAGVAVGRLSAMVADGSNPLAAPADILVVRAGVATGPAATAALAWMTWAGRRELPAVLSGLSTAALAGLGGWHAGCVIRAACLGTRSDLPWALVQPGSVITRHPVEIYAAILFGTATLAIGMLKSRLATVPWLVSGLALAAAGAIRLGTEPFRPSLTSAPGWWYVAAIVAGAAAVIGQSVGGLGYRPPAR